MPTDYRTNNNDVRASTVDSCNLWNMCKNWRRLTIKKSKEIAEPKKSQAKKKSKATYLDKYPDGNS